jgi:arabinofuranan 3-O-arabinosyltransferase
MGTRIAALLFAAVPVIRAISEHVPGTDNERVRGAAVTWLHGGFPYADPRFLYLPSSVLAAAPEARLSIAEADMLAHVAVAVCAVAGVYAAFEVAGVSWRSWAPQLAVGGLAVFGPYVKLVEESNWTAAAALAMPATLLLASRERWTLAGVVAGASILFKPMLVPLLVVFVLARRPRALAWAAGIPLVVNAIAVLAVSHPGMFLTRTVPFIASGQDHVAQPYDASLGAVLPQLGVPVLVSDGIRAVVLAAGCVLVLRRWRRPGGSARLRLAETGCLIMVTVFLVSRPAFDHYALLVVPLLAASLAEEGAAARSTAFAAAVMLMAAGLVLPEIARMPALASYTAAFALILGVLAIPVLRPPRVSDTSQLAATDAVSAPAP